MYKLDDNRFADIFRYMGAAEASDDAVLRSLAQEAATRVLAAAVPRNVMQTVALTVNGTAEIDYAGIRVISTDLARHLEGCDRVMLFASTLGCDVDRLIERDSRLQPSLALAEQAAAAVLIEQYADACCCEAESALPQDYHLTPRFSPGYGDCALSEQTHLLRVLQAHKRIGLTLTDSFMMAPMKSISGWLGITTQPTVCYGSGCAVCGRLHCAFRKAEMTV